MDFVAQAVGIVAMVFNIFSYQCKRPKGIIALQFFGAFFFGVSYFLLGSYIGALLNCVGVIRAVLFLKRETFRPERLTFLVVFGLAYVGAYICNFTLLGKAPTAFNFTIELLPVIGMFATHLAYRYDSAKTIRRFCLISSVCWLIFNVVNVAIGAILCEVFSLISIVVAMIRLDKKA